LPERKPTIDSRTIVVDKITEIYCLADEFCEKISKRSKNNSTQISPMAKYTTNYPYEMLGLKN
jgi:hypothetical protein